MGWRLVRPGEFWQAFLVDDEKGRGEGRRGCCCSDRDGVNSIDIAIAVGKILDQCAHEVAPYGLKASGQEPANRNSNIVVHAVLRQ